MITVNYPALQPHASTPFKCYAADFAGAKKVAKPCTKKSRRQKPRDLGFDLGDGTDEDEEEPDFHERSTLMVGETEGVEFVTDPLETQSARAQLGCR